MLLGAVEDSQPEVLRGVVEDSPALEVLPGGVEDSPEAVGEEDTNLIALVACSFRFLILDNEKCFNNHFMVIIVFQFLVFDTLVFIK